VDALEYPIDNLVAGYDDFARFRQRFGGNHTGLDTGFDRWGDPVRASARGRVTYADPEGWDTEKGVVIVEHYFPDGSLIYTLYGHMEETETIRFPRVGTCVELGSLLGTIGWPSRGRPHLHYEIRRILPDDGGPGYVTGNPLDEGWYNPLDFTTLWRLRFSPAFSSFLSFDTVPALPPVRLSGEQYVVAGGNTLSALLPPTQVLWRVETGADITAVAALPGDRVVAQTSSGQVFVLLNGRYLAAWALGGAAGGFVALSETLFFALADGGLSAYDSAGTQLWALGGAPGTQVVGLQAGIGQIALTLQIPGGFVWRLINVDGTLAGELALNAAPIVAPALDGSWAALAGTELLRWNGVERQTLATVNPLPGAGAQIALDNAGGIYLYLADSDSTLLAFGAAGEARWRATFPRGADGLPPLLRAGGSCLLYVLDGSGMLSAFAAGDGRLINQAQLYGGGTRNSNPRSRFLSVQADGSVQAGAGYLTLVTLDGLRFGGEAAGCVPS
jgi:murein DD-endopeptidase MepM/ murein hydrolase activator NlpD